MNTENKSICQLPKGYQLKHTPEVGWWVEEVMTTSMERRRLNKGDSANKKLTNAKNALSKAEALLATKKEALAAEQLKLAPLVEEVHALREQVRNARGEALLANIPSLLSVVTNHASSDRGDLCNDKSMGKVGTCPRCTLLYLKDNEWDVANYGFEITVTKE